MLIRGETTEERIAKIAQGFGQGIQNFQQGQDRKRTQGLQDEALRRQQALDAQNTENNAEDRAMKREAFGISQDLQKLKLEQAGLPFNQTDEFKKLEAVESMKAKHKAPTMSYEDKLNMKAQKDAETKAAERQDPVYKLEKLGAEGRSKVGALSSGFQALDQMEKAMKNGHGPQHIDANTPLAGRLISDNPYSEGERVLTEVVGRLQSGGAMGENEVKTFKALGPKAGDDSASKNRKLLQQKDFLQNKLTAFGLNNDDMKKLGFETSSKYGQDSVNTKAAAPVKITQQHVDTVKSKSDAELYEYVFGGK